jgi:glycosyltransferase involved in cell wall biosynthesis
MVDEHASRSAAEPTAGALPEVLILNWRDTGHPEGGGSERYVEEVAAGLARRGHRVTLVGSAYPGAAAREHRADGVQLVRLGGRLSLYPRTALAYLRGHLGRPGVVIEVQNGMPFLARLWARPARVLVLVHHVHREQWRVVLPAPLARLGWWIESVLAPRVNRDVQYIAVSDTTRRELAALGVPARHIAVVHNGTPRAPDAPAQRSTTPLLLVVSRLVPHKRVELAVDALAELSDEFPGLELVVAGRGWWDDELHSHVAARGLQQRVRFAGFVSEEEKARLYGRAWVSLVPSLKEGWGLVVVEAGVHATPSVGFRAAGGVAESIRDGVTGLLADDQDGFVAAVARLLRDRQLRERLGRNAAAHAAGFTWADTVDGVAALLTVPAADRPVGHPVLATRRGSGPRSVVHQRRLDLGLRRLGGSVDADPGQPGQDRGDQRRQCDPHRNLPAPLGGAAPATGVRPAPWMAPSSTYRGLYRRVLRRTAVQSPAATRTPVATTSPATTAADGAVVPRVGSFAAAPTHGDGTSYNRTSEPS